MFSRMVAVVFLAVLMTGQANATAYSAKAVVVMDARTGQVVESEQGEQIMGPASLAKMMTLYLLFTAVEQGHVNWDEKARVSEKAWRMGGSKMFLRESTRVPLSALAKGIGIVSGNDACIVVAEHLSGSEDGFVQWMNETAAELGLENTHFGTATGMPSEGQVTNALDMARMARALITTYPKSLEILSTRTLTFEDITQRNRNRLLWKDIGVDGVKTGHTEESGYHLVASGERAGQRFIVAVMGADSKDSREEIAQRYLMTAYRKYATVEPLAAHDVVAEVTVWKGVVNRVNAVPETPGIITIRRDQEDLVSVTLTLGEVQAPVQKGQVLGLAQVRVGDVVVREIRLVAEEAVEEGGFFKRLWHGLMLFMRDLLDKLF